MSSNEIKELLSRIILKQIECQYSSNILLRLSIGSPSSLILLAFLQVNWNEIENILTFSQLRILLRNLALASNTDIEVSLALYSFMNQYA